MKNQRKKTLNAPAVKKVKEVATVKWKKTMSRAQAQKLVNGMTHREIVLTLKLVQDVETRLGFKPTLKSSSSIEKKKMTTLMIDLVRTGSFDVSLTDQREAAIRAAKEMGFHFAKMLSSIHETLQSVTDPKGVTNTLDLLEVLRVGKDAKDLSIDGNYDEGLLGLAAHSLGMVTSVAGVDKRGTSSMKKLSICQAVKTLGFATFKNVVVQEVSETIENPDDKVEEIVSDLVSIIIKIGTIAKLAK